MRKVILEFPNQFKEGIERAREIKIEGEFSNIIVCGMGGSALPANLLVTYLADLKFPLYIHRSYNLPLQANKKSLIICISYSGNTEETISAFEETRKRNLKTIVITTGGKLKELAETYNTPLVLLPGGIQPRSAIGYLFSALVKVLSNSGVVKDRSKEILETAKNLNSAEFKFSAASKISLDVSLITPELDNTFAKAEKRYPMADLG